MRLESSKGKEIESLDDIKCPNKWQWSTEWWINTTDEVDEEGIKIVSFSCNITIIPTYICANSGVRMTGIK